MNLELTISNEAVAEIAANVANLKGVTEIASDSQSRMADTYLRGAKKLVKAVKDSRMAVTRQADAFKKACIAREAEVCKEVNAEIERVSALQVAFLDAKKAEAEAANAEALVKAAESGVAPTEPEQTGKVAGVTSREYWGFEIVDPAAVPREFCIPSEKLVREHMNRMKAEGHDITAVQVAGVKFYRETRV